jgi:hypothetical protein
LAGKFKEATKTRFLAGRLIKNWAGRLKNSFLQENFGGKI